MNLYTQVIEKIMCTLNTAQRKGTLFIQRNTTGSRATHSKPVAHIFKKYEPRMMILPSCLVSYLPIRNGEKNLLFSMTVARF